MDGILGKIQLLLHEISISALQLYLTSMAHEEIQEIQSLKEVSDLHDRKHSKETTEAFYTLGERNIGNAYLIRSGVS